MSQPLYNPQLDKQPLYVEPVAGKADTNYQPVYAQVPIATNPMVPMYSVSLSFFFKSRLKPFHQDDWYMLNDAYYYGPFYINSNDPNTCVPKRWGFGWTLNFGHKRSIVIMILLLLFILASVLIGVLVSLYAQ